MILKGMQNLFPITDMENSRNLLSQETLQALGCRPMTQVLPVRQTYLISENHKKFSVAVVTEILSSQGSDKIGADEGIQCPFGSVGSVNSKSYSIQSCQNCLHPCTSGWIRITPSYTALNPCLQTCTGFCELPNNMTNSFSAEISQPQFLLLATRSPDLLQAESKLYAYQMGDFVTRWVTFVQCSEHLFPLLLNERNGTHLSIVMIIIQENTY